MAKNCWSGLIFRLIFIDSHFIILTISLTCIWKWLTNMCPLKIYVSWDFCFSVSEWCLILCHPMDSSTSGFPILHHPPELAQTHVHLVSDVMQPSHLLSSPSSPAFNPSQHQDFFQWVSFCIKWPNIGVLSSASVLPVNTQDWLVWSPCSPRDS